MWRPARGTGADDLRGASAVGGREAPMCALRDFQPARLGQREAGACGLGARTRNILFRGVGSRGRVRSTDGLLCLEACASPTRAGRDAFASQFSIPIPCPPPPTARHCYDPSPLPGLFSARAVRPSLSFSIRFQVWSGFDASGLDRSPFQNFPLHGADRLVCPDFQLRILANEQAAYGGNVGWPSIDCFFSLLSSSQEWHTWAIGRVTYPRH